MTTREMLSDELVEAMENLHQYPRLIAERAAREAVAAERDRIRAAVEGKWPCDRKDWEEDTCTWWYEHYGLAECGNCIFRAAVLAIVNPEADHD